MRSTTRPKRPGRNRRIFEPLEPRLFLSGDGVASYDPKRSVSRSRE